MTQSIPSDTSAEKIKDQHFMEMIAAEDVSNGEVGCGQLANTDFLAYLKVACINIDEESLRNLLQTHLGQVLTERDFDSIISQVSRYIESVAASANSLPTSIAQHQSDQTEHIPTTILQQLLQIQLGDFLQEGAIAQVIEFTHKVVHQAVLQPRHTWPNPIWVLKEGDTFYIAQAVSPDEAIEIVLAQHPLITSELEVVKVGGVLAPNQVIVLDTNDYL
ncbi:hypothetical protein [Scytonema sp. NUACC26]|uniref:hypothetical protein n=1 Tax=Scytonema sp. NUACC26 TaxID=3140176 RepID=UPI0034DBE0E6